MEVPVVKSNIYMLRRFRLHWANWSKIRFCYRGQLNAYLVIMVVPIIFSFVGEFNNLYLDFQNKITEIKNISNKIKDQAIFNFPESLRNYYFVSPQSNFQMPPISKPFYKDVKLNFQVLFFSALTLSLANLLHRFSPKEVVQFSCREFILHESSVAINSSDEYRELRYKEAMSTIVKHEEFFQKRYDKWSEFLPIEGKPNYIGGIENGALAHYEVISCSKPLLFSCALLLYCLGVGLSFFALTIRTLIVCNGW